MATPAFRIALAGLLIMYSVSRLIAAFRDKNTITFMGNTYARSKDRVKYFFALLVHVWLVGLMLFYIMRDAKHL